MTPTQVTGSAIARAQDRAVRMQIATPRHREGLSQFVEGLSPHSAYLRFFGADPRPTPRMLDLLSCNDRDHLAVIATVGGCVIGHAMLARRAYAFAEPSELAVVVADEWQHHGVGPKLVQHLVAHASRLVHDGLEFTVLADNFHANAVVQRLWPLATMSADHGVISYRVDVNLPRAATTTRAPLVA